ncbi:MAG: BrnT family toxin [Elusimicrobia bacterium]|nr:BrnT family toxin [Elusimicrobiota bacterium]
MTFEWHNEKAQQNALKHGIDFRTATFAFDDPCAFILDDARHSHDEKRQWLIGDSGSGILVVVFTVRSPGRRIRIISARRANQKERRNYAQLKGV